MLCNASKQARDYYQVEQRLMVCDKVETDLWTQLTNKKKLVPSCAFANTYVYKIENKKHMKQLAMERYSPQ